MSKSKLNIELDRTEINKDAIPEASLDELYDGIGYERDREGTFKESKKDKTSSFLRMMSLFEVKINSLRLILDKI